jgi:hypothetical protein
MSPQLEIREQGRDAKLQQSSAAADACIFMVSEQTKFLLLISRPPLH